jgi:hypothetical protein
LEGGSFRVSRWSNVDCTVLAVEVCFCLPQQSRFRSRTRRRFGAIRDRKVDIDGVGQIHVVLEGLLLFCVVQRIRIEFRISIVHNAGRSRGKGRRTVVIWAQNGQEILVPQAARRAMREA